MNDTNRFLHNRYTIGLIAATAGLTLAGRRIAVGWLDGADDDYTVAEIDVSGPIRRKRMRPSRLSPPTGVSADDIVESIERADEDLNVEALLLRVNTPGGEVVPSDDIRRAAAAFDGPTIAYATDVCASGGYWIASGCDELWAHESSLVGSIGIVGSRPNLSGLAEKLGVSYEQFTAGEFKDAGVPLKELEPEEREYLQGIVDGLYERFVETVSDGMGIDPETIRETEARLYLGSDAHEIGLVDGVGTIADVEAHLESLIDSPVEIREFTPERGLAARLGLGAQRAAYVAGRGVADGVAGDREFDVELR